MCKKPQYCTVYYSAEEREQNPALFEKTRKCGTHKTRFWMPNLLQCLQRNAMLPKFSILHFIPFFSE